MINQREEVIKLAKEFTELCHKHDIWYVLIDDTLLSTIKLRRMFSWSNKFEVMMTYESFEKLKQFACKNILDNLTNPEYPFLYPKFLSNKNDYMETPVCLDIFLIIPSNETNVAKFISRKIKRRYRTNLIHSYSKHNMFWYKIGRVMTSIFKRKSYKITYKESSSLLYSKKHTGHFIMKNPYEPASKNWIQTFSMDRAIKKFEKFIVFVPFKWKNILIEKYGKDYKNIQNKHKIKKHKDVINKDF